MAYVCHASWPGLSRPSTSFVPAQKERKAWMPGPSPGMTLTRASAPLARRAPHRNSGKHERDDRIVAGERKAEEAPGRLVAAHHIHRLELLDEARCRAEIVERARAFLRAGPPLPFHAG